MFKLSYRFFAVTFLFYAVESFGENNTVVVIPLIESSNDIGQCTVSSACDLRTNETTVTCSDTETVIPCNISNEGFRTVFVTSTLHGGDLGGVSGADSICQSRALSSGLSGTYFAWLSSGTPSNISPNSRFNQLGTFVDVFGDVIAANYEELTSGSLVRPISIDETGSQVFSTNIISASVWTNTISSGEPSSIAGNFSCNNFTSNSALDLGAIGNYTSREEDWTFFGQVPCDQELRLYCFEQ